MRAKSDRPRAIWPERNYRARRSTPNELLSDGTWNYTYDAAGNQIGKVNIATGETWTYVYNNANELISATDESSSGTVLQQETNTYDVFGQRIAETETTGGSTTTTEMSYDQNGTLYADLNSSGTITTRYISSVTGPDEWLARVDATGGGAWLLSDHLGSVRTVVALTGGTVLDQITFDPFGTITSQTNSANMGRLGFQGGQLDPITVTYNFGPRNYNPGTGTWTTQDPTGLQAGSNPYEFDDNSPTDMTDPTGMAPQPSVQQQVAQANARAGETWSSPAVSDLLWIRYWPVAMYLQQNSRLASNFNYPKDWTNGWVADAIINETIANGNSNGYNAWVAKQGNVPAPPEYLGQLNEKQVAQVPPQFSKTGELSIAQGGPVYGPFEGTGETLTGQPSASQLQWQEARQKAAMAQRVSETEIRLGGAVRAYGGGVEIAVGVLLIAGGGPLGILVGGALVYRGSDNVITGAREAVRGEASATVTQTIFGEKGEQVATAIEIFGPPAAKLGGKVGGLVVENLPAGKGGTAAPSQGANGKAPGGTVKPATEPTPLLDEIVNRMDQAAAQTRDAALLDQIIENAEFERTAPTTGTAPKTVSSIATPYGPALQSTSEAALAARAQVEGGAKLYRIGTLGRSGASEAQFWALESPTSPGYAQKYGIPAENVANADIITVGKLKPGTSFITREAPGIGANKGGGIEVVVPENGVQLEAASVGKGN